MNYKGWTIDMIPKGWFKHWARASSRMCSVDDNGHIRVGCFLLTSGSFHMELSNDRAFTYVRAMAKIKDKIDEADVSVSREDGKQLKFQ